MSWNDIGNTSSVYYKPEAVGWTQIGQVSWQEEKYEFDLTVLWQETETKKLYWASDSGCSCPLPFEYHRGPEDFSTGSRADFVEHLNHWATKAEMEGNRYALAQIIELFGKVMLGDC